MLKIDYLKKCYYHLAFLLPKKGEMLMKIICCWIDQENACQAGLTIATHMSQPPLLH